MDGSGENVCVEKRHEWYDRLSQEVEHVREKGDMKRLQRLKEPSDLGWESHTFQTARSESVVMHFGKASA